MSKELIISSDRHETKVAILEDDQLVEIFFQRANEYSLAGSIHKGRVTRVLPGMQSAFVDLGLDRDAFLYVSDFFEGEDEEFETVPNGEDRSPRRERSERPERAERTDRVERHERSERSDRAERSEPSPASVTSQPVAVVLPPSPPPPQAIAAAPTAAGAGAVLQRERDPRGEDDRRGGRRSRRRRNRGRGFPESKYASTSEPAQQGEAEEAREDSNELPLILPGESLAKYSRGEHTESAPAEAEAEAGQGDDERESEPAEAGFEPDAEAETAEASEVEPEVSHAAPEPEFAGPQRTPDPPPPIEEPEDPQPEPQEDPPLDEPEPFVEVVAEGREHHTEDEEPIASVADALALEEALDELEAGSSGEGDPRLAEIENLANTDVPEPEDAEESAPEPGDSGEPLAAAVRGQQQSRYTQRVSRRMRRKMRNSDRGDTAPAAEIARPEPPKVVARPTAPERDRSPQPSISELLREGQEILVQIAKEPIGQKGARITSHIALPGRYVVFMPTVDHVGVSRKISTDEERLRLKHILLAHRAGIPGGFIVRTAGEGKTEEEIAGDMKYLHNLWLDIRQKAEKRPAPLLLHHDLEIVQRILRDQLTETFKAIWVDNEELYENVLRFLQRFQPALISRVKMYTRPAPIFDAFNVSPELEKALRPKVWLKSGGYIVINQTEALVAIDVNTGKYVGKSNRLEDTIVKTNLEAVKEIVRQIRLRDLGGIIVVDFIDMDERKNRQKVMQALEETMRVDRAPYKILQFNDFGLVAITRKRVKQSLERTLCAPCPACEGAGYVKSVQTVIGEILQESHKIARAIEGKEVMLRVHPEVAKTLKSNANKFLEELEEVLGRPVMVVSDPTLMSDRFDLT